MKKKFWLTALLAVALMLLLGGAALADYKGYCEVCGDWKLFRVQSITYIDDDQHEVIFACEGCSARRNDQTPHSGGTATCTQKAVCDGCKREYGDFAPHSFTTRASGQLASAATCTEAAKYYAQCDNCDAVSDTVTVSVGDPAGHKYANSYKSAGDGTYYRACQNAGCTARDGGYRLYRIIHSGGDGGGLWSAQKYSKEDTCTLSILSNVPAYAGHTFLYWQDDAGNRYTSGDSITLTSASTDIWVRAVYEKIETECDKYGHLFTYTPYFQQHKATCDRCGYETTESHVLNAEQTQCTKCGAYRYKLTFISGFGNPQWGSTEYSAKESCDISITTSVPTCSGGTFDHWTDGSGQYRAGDEYTLTAGNPTATLYAVFSHEGACSGDDSANCTEYGTCQYCRKPYLDPYNHSFTSKPSDELASAATCTEAAKYYVQCDRCGAVSETETVSVGDPMGHDYSGAPATCTEPQICAREGCGAVLDSAKGHTPVTDAAVAPTCTATGLTEGTHCEVCGDVLVAQQIVPMTGHNYRSATKAPACTEGGYTIYTCINCGDRYTANETSPRGHWFGEWSANGDDTHSALCRRNGCKHTGTTACAWFDGQLLMQQADEAYAFTFCPVCGEVSDGARLPLVEAAKAEALTETLPRGELVLRMGELANGETILSVGFEYSGKLTQPTGEVKITIPAALLEGYTLSLLDADGAESALPCAIEDGEASFTLSFAPEDGEEAPAPIRLIHLRPVSA